MKISTEKFNLYNSVINRAKDKDRTIRSTMFIDPDRGFCSCLGSDFNFKFNFDIIEENKEDLKPFRIDIERFLAVASIYPEIIIDENYHFQVDDDKFKIYIEKNISDNSYTFNYNDDNVKTLDLRDGDLVSIERALQFVGEEQQAGKNFNFVRIGEGGNKIVSSNGSSIYENSLNEEIDFAVDISDNVGFLIIDLFRKGFNEINLSFNDSQNSFSFKDPNNQFEVITEPIADVYSPGIDKLEEFKNAIKRAGNLTFEVKRVPFKRIIDFLGVFVSNSLNEPISVIFNDGKMKIEGNDDNDNSSGSRAVPENFIINVSQEMDNLTISFPRKIILQAIGSTFESEDIKFEVGVNEDGIHYFIQVSEIGGSVDEKVISILLRM